MNKAKRKLLSGVKSHRPMSAKTQGNTGVHVETWDPYANTRGASAHDTYVAMLREMEGE